jgi:hypothetical protein
MALTDKLGYVQVAATTKVVKSTPAGLFSITCTGAGQVDVYDNASAGTGTKLYSKSMALGDIATWGSHGIAANNGITVVAVGTVNVAYT